MELNHLPTGLSQGWRIWQTHILHSLCPWTTGFPAVSVSGRLRHVSTDPVPKHVFGTPKYQGKQILQWLWPSLSGSHCCLWQNGIILSSPRLICQGIFLLVRGKKTKQDMLELPLHWWVLLLPCHSAEQGGWGRSPGSKPQIFCCTFLQKASHLAQSLRNRVSRQQTNKSGLIKKENNPLSNVKGSHYCQY